MTFKKYNRQITRYKQAQKRIDRYAAESQRVNRASCAMAEILDSL